MTYWEKIMESFSYKTKGGAPDFTNPNHRLLLRKELLNNGWNPNAVNAILSNLTENKRTEFLKSLGVDRKACIGTAIVKLINFISTSLFLLLIALIGLAYFKRIETREDLSDLIAILKRRNSK